MKTYIPLDRLKRSRDSGSALYNMHPTDVLGRAGGGCPKTYWDIKQIVLVNFYLFYYSCLTLYILETQLFCLYL